MTKKEFSRKKDICIEEKCLMLVSELWLDSDPLKLPIKESHFLFSHHRMAGSKRSQLTKSSISYCGKGLPWCDKVPGTIRHSSQKGGNSHLWILETLFLGAKHPLILIPLFFLHLFTVFFMSRSSSLDLWGDLLVKAALRKNMWLKLFRCVPINCDCIFILIGLYLAF